MRSDANFRLSECQPLPRLGSSPASLSARFHQKRVCVKPTHSEGFLVAGRTGASAPAGLCLRPSARASMASGVTGVVCP